MDVSDQIRLHFLRELLVGREQALQAALAAARQGQGADARPTAVRADGAGLNATAQRRDLDELEGVQRALQRLDRGVYGHCVRCGEPMPMARLHLQPTLEHCQVCQDAMAHARPGGPQR